MERETEREREGWGETERDDDDDSWFIDDSSISCLECRQSKYKKDCGCS